MPQVIVNGRQVNVPEVASGRQIQAAGGIDPGRRVMLRDRKGNYVVKPDDRIHVQHGSVFVDAPQRVKGSG